MQDEITLANFTNNLCFEHANCKFYHGQTPKLDNVLQSAYTRVGDLEFNKGRGVENLCPKWKMEWDPGGVCAIKQDKNVTKDTSLETVENFPC